MHFPIIHTNFWDAVIAVPLVMILTQFINPFGIFTIRLTHLSLTKEYYYFTFATPKAK